VRSVLFGTASGTGGGGAYGGFGAATGKASREIRGTAGSSTAGQGGSGIAGIPCLSFRYMTTSWLLTVSNRRNRVWEVSQGLTTSQPPGTRQWRNCSTACAIRSASKYISTLRQKMMSIALVLVASDGKGSSARLS